MTVDWGAVPQWATVLVAVVAGIIAYSSVKTQRDTARRRASLDILLKTVTDPGFIKHMNEYVDAMQKFADSGAMEYDRITPYLNVLDLIAVGIHNRVLNEDVCFDFWCDQVIRAYNETKEYIETLRSHANKPLVFSDLENLATRWEARRKEMVEKHLKAGLGGN